MKAAAAGAEAGAAVVVEAEAVVAEEDVGGVEGSGNPLCRLRGKKPLE